MRLGSRDPVAYFRYFFRRRLGSRWLAQSDVRPEREVALRRLPGLGLGPHQFDRTREGETQMSGERETPQHHDVVDFELPDEAAGQQVLELEVEGQHLQGE